MSSTPPQQEKPLLFSTAARSPFSLKLMTGRCGAQLLALFSKQFVFQESFSSLPVDDWLDERFSNNFLLGEPLHLKAWYSGPESRQLFVDNCVATLTPDPKSVPRYYFIRNHG